MRRLVFVTLFLLVGCHKFVPLEGPTSSLERGAELRAFFSEGQSIDLHDVTAHNITSMDVEFVRQEGSELVFSAFYLDSSSRSGGYLGNGSTVRVPAESISDIQVKKFDIWLTTGILAVAILASYLSWDAIAGSGNGQDLVDDPVPEYWRGFYPGVPGGGRPPS